VRFALSSRRLFRPERWVAVGFLGARGSIFTPQVFKGTGEGGTYGSRDEVLADLRDAFETPGRLDDSFVQATKGWTFQAMRIDDGVTNGILRAVAAGGL
jgi:hypothetical protein